MMGKLLMSVLLSFLCVVQTPDAAMPNPLASDAVDPAEITVSEPVELNVALYKSIPEYDSFEATVKECWKEAHPEVELVFTDWNCYGDEVPSDLDVFVFDTTNLDLFAEKGFLLPLAENDIQDYEDLIPFTVDGCRVDGKLYAVPQILCMDLLYTRKGDAELEHVQSVFELYGVLKDDGLLMDKKSDTSKVCAYLQALTDETQHYLDIYPPIEEGQLSQGAVDSMTELGDMRQTDPEMPVNSDRFYYAKKFAQGMGRAYIGYSEAMDLMGDSAAEMDFRLFSSTDGVDIPLFYVDAAAVNAKISDQKKELALELLNMITGRDLLVKASNRDGDPRYLLLARNSAYDDLMADYPIYTELKQIASVPGACVFRIKPDGAAYMEQAEKNADVLPSLIHVS